MQKIQRATVPIWPAPHHRGFPVFTSYEVVHAGDVLVEVQITSTVLGLEVVSSPKPEIIQDAIDRYLSAKNN